MPGTLRGSSLLSDCSRINCYLAESMLFIFFLMLTFRDFKLIAFLLTFVSSTERVRSMKVRLLVFCQVVTNSLWPHEIQHTRLLCLSPSPRVCSNSCPSSQWCHPTISSSVIPFSSHLQSFPASGYFPMSHLFTSGGQSIGALASASVLPVNIQGWFPLGLSGLISL